MITVILLSSFILFILSGVPIGFCLGVSSVVALLVWGDVPMLVIVQRTFTGIDIFTLMAVPLFMLAGEIMKGGRMVSSLIGVSNLLVGHIRGGLAYVNVLASMFFGGITGSAVADLSALGSIEIQMMTKAGYNRSFSTATSVASSIMGPIIPPSILMIVYAFAVPGVSIGALFLAGVGPGVFIGLSQICIIAMMAKRRNFPKTPVQINRKVIATVLKDSVFAIMMPIIVIGGIVSGAFTATESASIAVLYSFVVNIFITRDTKVKDIPGILLRASIMAGTVFIIVGFASLFGWILTTQQVPQVAASIVSEGIKNPALFLLLVNIFLLIVGCFMEGAAAIMIVAPVFAPIAIKMGIDPVHFGIVFVVNLCIGLMTPPVGLALFVGCNIGNVTLEELSKEVMPYVAAAIVTLMLITYVPAIPLFLPSILMK